jgi:hypothetical protein
MTWAVEDTVGAIYIGAAKSIGAALFAAILGHLKKLFRLFFRKIYFRMLRIRILKKIRKFFFVGPYFEFFLKRDENLRFFSISCSFCTY